MINTVQGEQLIVGGKIKSANSMQIINDNVSEEAAEEAIRDKVEKLTEENK